MTSHLPQSGDVALIGTRGQNGQCYGQKEFRCGSHKNMWLAIANRRTFAITVRRRDTIYECKRQLRRGGMISARLLFRSKHTILRLHPLPHPQVL